MIVRGQSGCTRLRLLSPTLATLPVLSSSGPHQKRSPPPARHDHSHCASVGKSKVIFSVFFTFCSHLQNSLASVQLTCTTGCSSFSSNLAAMNGFFQFVPGRCFHSAFSSCALPPPVFST